MRLQEIFKPGGQGIQRWDLIQSSPVVAHYVFMVDDVGYEVFFERMAKPTWDMMFIRRDMETGHDTSEITPGGKAVSVFATVIDILRDFQSKHSDMQFLTFSAKEPSRQRLYRRFAAKVDPNFKEEDAKDPEGHMVKKYTVKT